MGQDSSKHDERQKSTSAPTTALNALAVRSTSSSGVHQSDLSNLAVITVIFNPIKYKSRYDHYDKFVQHMSDSGVNLTTVECIFEAESHLGLPRQNFEVTNSSNQFHVQLVAPSIMWLKENLINIAVKRLPQNIEYIAWLDADLEFERLDWPQLTINELQRYPIVQLFQLAYFLGPGGKDDVLRRDFSFGYSIRTGQPITPHRSNDWYAHPGYAWAMRRSAFIIIGGLIDFCIVGSGDLHFAFALLNRVEETIRPGLHEDYRKLCISWGARVAQVALKGNAVSYVPVNLWHHYHGDRTDRRYVDRWSILEIHQFSPLKDLQKNEDTGLLRLADKRNLRNSKMVARIEAIERDLVAYFRLRNEDKNVGSIPMQPLPANKTKPFVANKTQTRRGGTPGTKIFSSGPSKGGIRPHMLSTGTHVDYHDAHRDQCTCPGHHHHPGNHNCPCEPNHTDAQHCWNPYEQEHHHYSNAHHQDNDFAGHHHHSNAHFAGHHSSHASEHHGNWDNDHSGYDYGHSSGGHGSSHTDYAGAGSFY